jgi:hypothetical protein
MQRITGSERWRTWLVDYSAARTRAVEWLGDRYLLAKPVNRITRKDLRETRAAARRT